MSSILRDGGYRGPKLSKSNFTVWKFCMENHLKAKDMWAFIESPTTVDDKTKQAKCFTTIVSSLCEDQIMTVIETSTLKVIATIPGERYPNDVLITG